MMREMLYASDFLDKDVLNLETGDLVGRITGLLVCEDPLRVSAFAYRVEEEKGSRLAFCSFSQVTDIDQQVVVISSSQSYLARRREKPARPFLPRFHRQAPR